MGVQGERQGPGVTVRLVVARSIRATSTIGNLASEIENGGRSDCGIYQHGRYVAVLIRVILRGCGRKVCSQGDQFHVGIDLS
jgi:hypothetical protein